jgi:formylglycine-generating enzyme required for sulfatase activity
VTRAGTTTGYWWGSSISTSQANYNSTRTVPVDSFEPNPWGLYQVHGNVWEWTEDCYQDYNGAPTDGSARTSGNCISDLARQLQVSGGGSVVEDRVVRGGSWVYGPRGLRSAVRGSVFSDSRGFSIGFRLARTLTPHASLIGQLILDHSSVAWTLTIIPTSTVRLGKTLSK